jgi:hypothetical protein
MEVRMMRGGRMAIIGGLASLAAIGWSRPWKFRPCPSELLDGVLPDYEFRDTISLEVPSEPRRIMRALRELRLLDMRAAWLLGELRYLPQQLVHHGPAADRAQPFVALLRTGVATVVLAERPDELAFGSIGRLHGLTGQDLQPLTGAHAFREFGRPGFQKQAMSVKVTQLEPGRCRVTVEHRVQALGLGARLWFGLYWLTIKPGGAFASWQMLRAIRTRAMQPEPIAAVGVEPEEHPEVTDFVRDLEASFA